MKPFAHYLPIGAIAFVLIGCASPPPPGSKEAAVNDAWDRFCKAGYCEGYPGTIVSRSDNSITVGINGNIRYIRYVVTGSAGNYQAQVSPTADSGRTRP